LFFRCDPSDMAVFLKGESITISVDASDSDGTDSEIRLFINNTGATNESGFTAIGSGWRSPSETSGATWYIYRVAFIWSSTETFTTTATTRNIQYNTDGISRWSEQKNSGMSVRCLMD